MARILIVDDDPSIRELVDVTLRQSGFDVLHAPDGQSAWQLLAQEKVDLVVLDLMMPGMNGWDLCQRIREEAVLPIVMLTARASTADTVRGLHLGADDYLTKPFEPAELVARIQTVLRRFRIATDQELTIGTVRLDGRTGQATIDGDDIAIRPKEFLLLFQLASYPGRTQLREHLIEEVWGMDFDGDERTLDVHIKRLREKFPPEHSPFVIRTMRGLGYRLEVLS